MLKKLLIALGLKKAPKRTYQVILASQAVRYGKFGIPVMLGALAWRYRDKLKPKRRRAVTSPY